MTTLLDDLRLALRQMCGTIGLSGTVSSVVSLVVLGVALNVAALSVMESMRNVRHAGHRQIRTALRSATQTEVKVMKAVVTSTLKKMRSSRRNWCLARQWMLDRRTEMLGYKLEVGFVSDAPGREGCNVEIVTSSHQKMAIALVRC